MVTIGYHISAHASEGEYLDLVRNSNCQERKHIQTSGDIRC